MGGLYLAGPALGWLLLPFVLRACYLAPALPKAERPDALPAWLVAWLICMPAMLVALLVGHAQFELGLAQTVKSGIGWAKGWALLALFPLAGFVLPIRLSALARASCRLGSMTLALLPIFLLAPALGLPLLLGVVESSVRTKRPVWPNWACPDFAAAMWLVGSMPILRGMTAPLRPGTGRAPARG